MNRESGAREIGCKHGLLPQSHANKLEIIRPAYQSNGGAGVLRNIHIFCRSNNKIEVAVGGGHAGGLSIAEGATQNERHHDHRPKLCLVMENSHPRGWRSHAPRCKFQATVQSVAKFV